MKESYEHCIECERRRHGTVSSLYWSHVKNPPKKQSKSKNEKTKHFAVRLIILYFLSRLNINHIQEWRPMFDSFMWMLFGSTQLEITYETQKNFYSKTMCWESVLMNIWE